mmetsp:Transcript_147713/g.275213  ORF Transcript_147713/g.275213 Transcript_147713/m.275213 type:complete len:122 (-) Transcript_147713:35-400(-)
MKLLGSTALQASPVLDFGLDAELECSEASNRFPGAVYLAFSLRRLDAISPEENHHSPLRARDVQIWQGDKPLYYNMPSHTCTQACHHALFSQLTEEVAVVHTPWDSRRRRAVTNAKAQPCY